MTHQFWTHHECAEKRAKQKLDFRSQGHSWWTSSKATPFETAHSDKNMCWKRIHIQLRGEHAESLQLLICERYKIVNSVVALLFTVRGIYLHAYTRRVMPLADMVRRYTARFHSLYVYLGTSPVRKNWITSKHKGMYFGNLPVEISFVRLDKRYRDTPLWYEPQHESKQTAGQLPHRV